MNQELLSDLQRRTARLAVGPSTARGQGAPGLVAAAREFLAELPLRPFSVSNPARFRSRLDAATLRLMRALPRKGSSWGMARKLLNIFLRDAVYSRHLAQAFALRKIEPFLELPLDSITAKALRRQTERGLLPRWPGVRHLSMKSSDQFQSRAAEIAREQGMARVHLDALWWGGR